MTITFIQFFRPDGRTRKIDIERPIDVDRMARDLVRMGYRFEIETLRDGNVHMSVSIGGEDIVSRICENGPMVRDNIDSMIRGAHIATTRGESNE
jgi:hypothetical protein